MKTMDEFKRMREYTKDVDAKIHEVGYCRICKRYRSLTNKVCPNCRYAADRAKRGLPPITLYTT